LIKSISMNKVTNMNSGMNSAKLEKLNQCEWSSLVRETYE